MQKKEGIIMIKKSLLVMSFMLAITLSACGNDEASQNAVSQETTQQEETNQTEIVPENETEQEEDTDTRDYDKLQSLFLAFNFETTEDDLIKWIEDTGLEYTAEEYNSRPNKIDYKIAYEHDVALQKYAKSGDYIEISFSEKDGSFMYAEYFNNNTFKTALFYNYGIYWKFMENEGNNKYSGYYYHTSGVEEGGITIEYSNGNSTETGYNNVNNGEDALSGVLD